VREGGGPLSIGRSHRRRRSASPLPPPPVAVEMPYDTAGRVTFLAVTPAADVRPAPAPAEPPEPAARPPLPRLLRGWYVVTAAGAAVLVLFLLGMALTR
jgi:hypothetical protein